MEKNDRKKIIEKIQRKVIKKHNKIAIEFSPLFLFISVYK